MTHYFKGDETRFPYPEGTVVFTCVSMDHVYVAAHEDGYWAGLFGSTAEMNKLTLETYANDELREEFKQGLLVGGRSQQQHTCYRCEKKTTWLAPDGRCGDCTGCTPEEVRGEA